MKLETEYFPVTLGSSLDALQSNLLDQLRPEKGVEAGILGGNGLKTYPLTPTASRTVVSIFLFWILRLPVHSPPTQHYSSVIRPAAEWPNSISKLTEVSDFKAQRNFSFCAILWNPVVQISGARCETGWTPRMWVQGVPTTKLRILCCELRSKPYYCIYGVETVRFFSSIPVMKVTILIRFKTVTKRMIGVNSHDSEKKKTVA